jgi:putative flavoprotein involved in K+ transport
VSNSDATQLVEEGTAMELAPRRRAQHAGPGRVEEFDVIVIGGGQAGLSVGYHLAGTGLRFVILDASERIGNSWRKRWDSLRLFTAAKFDGLDGMPFPAARNAFPTKDEMAAYLETYAARFRLPVRSGVRVERLIERNGGYLVRAGGREIAARQVVVAMSKYQKPRVPAFAGEFSGRIRQLHSSDYRNTSQLQPGAVLLVGAGNSGADIALEVVRSGRQTWLAGRSPGEVPFRPDSFLGRNVMQPLVLRGVFHHLFTVDTAIGRKVRPAMLHKAGPLIRVKSRDLTAAGVERVPRVIGARDGLPLLADDRTVPVANLIWCTGFDQGFDWIDMPVFGNDGTPSHHCGVVDGHPGLYFVGLQFLYAMSSSMVHGVGRDAERIVRDITVHASVRRPSSRWQNLRRS